MERNNLVVKVWMFFGFNYPEPKEFIHYICEKTGKMYAESHLNGKFKHYRELVGCYGVMEVFYSELDADLQEALVDYAVTVYAPKGVTLTEEQKSLLMQ